MQMIFLCTIVAVPYPAETYMFFNGRIFFKLDLFRGQDLAEKYLNFSDSLPINGKFADFGFESMSFLPNSGSIMIIQVLIVLYFITKALLNVFASCCARSKSCRKIGIWADEKDVLTKMKSVERKFYLEAYLSLAFCSAISIYDLSSFLLTEDLENYDYGSYVQKPGNIVSAIFAIYFSISAILYPIFGSDTVAQYFGSLHRPDLRYELGHFYEGIKTRDMQALKFTTYFTMRRLLTVGLLVGMVSLPFFQT